MTALSVAGPSPRIVLPRSVRGVASVAVGLVVPVAGLVLWGVLAWWGWLAPQILPSPAEVWQAAVEIAANGELLTHAGFSLLRVVQGFVIGATIGVALGIAMGLSPTVEDYVKPLFTAFA